MVQQSSIYTIATQMHALVSDIPASMSGAMLIALVDRKRQVVQDYTGITVDATAIPLRFEDAIINLTAAEILQTVTTSSTSSSYKLGDLSSGDGTGSTDSTSQASYYEDLAEKSLIRLGRRVHMFRTY